MKTGKTMINEKDIYDLEVERLTKNPELITDSWWNAEPLFQLVYQNEKCDRSKCGCLTIIRLRPDMYAVSESGIDMELTDQIRADNRLPDYSNNIKPEHLPIFAEWQRKIDKRYNRKP